MGWRLDKSKAEIEDWMDELKENRERIQFIKEWPHIWVDFWGSLFEHMHYTLAHIVGIGLPLWALWAGIQWIGEAL